MSFSHLSESLSGTLFLPPPHMGGFFDPLTQIPFWVFIFFFFFCFVFLAKPSFGEDDSSQTLAMMNIGDIATSNDSSASPPPPPPPPPRREEPNTLPFRPSTTVIIGVLTTMFSVTFLLFLYAKQCERGNDVVVVYRNHAGVPAPTPARKNSGIDRALIDSLPLFRFGSLRGQKDGLECAVCLTRFDPTEVLRLLPKCKHAFHVECVDTWLQSHSTCPLCRYRVDANDIHFSKREEYLGLDKESPRISEFNPEFRRVSGRHSSAGEEGTGTGELSCSHDPTSCRRSLDSVEKSESVAVGCFDRPRKDGLLLAADRKSLEGRFDHRIIVSAGSRQRWSNVEPSDLLYLRTEMIFSESHRLSLASSRPPVRKQQQRHGNIIEIDSISGSGSGSGVINSRSVSEITGLSRFSTGESIKNHRQREAVPETRWLAWMSSQSQSQPAVQSDRDTHISTLV